MPTFDINQIPSQKGRVAIVTGANAGLGYETALVFAQKDLTVIMACRNLEKGAKARDKILQQVPGADLDLMQLDLSAMQSVREFAEHFLKKYNRLDLLVNNAGVMVPPYTETEDGFELQFATNYLGHFLLTGLLLDTVLQTPQSRVVSLSSIAHKNGKIRFEDLQSRKKYSAMGAYSQSKLACLLFAYEMQRRLEKKGSSTLSVAAHPGVSNTDLPRHYPKWTKIIEPLIVPIFTHSPKQAAEPTLYAALGQDVNGGDYFGPDGWNEMKGQATKVNSTPLSKDPEVARRLWEVSEELTGVRYL
ncbi:MAG: SDR family NAD(P)-dependent oxidoreductase [Lewinellaceae bacterium]|nr:SDR family NAD(P)-dependent oxidoreductase [Lewinellaceae bacterium]